MRCWLRTEAVVWGRLLQRGEVGEGAIVVDGGLRVGPRERAGQGVVGRVLGTDLAVVVHQPHHGQATGHAQRAVGALVGAEDEVPHGGGDAVVGRRVPEVVVEV